MPNACARRARSSTTGLSRTGPASASRLTRCWCGWSCPSPRGRRTSSASSTSFLLRGHPRASGARPDDPEQSRLGPRVKPEGDNNESLKKKTPRTSRGAIIVPKLSCRELRGLGVDLPGVGIADLDLARLHGLRDLADEIDVQQAVLQRGAGHLDVVG